jgi:hypothetical protein
MKSLQVKITSIGTGGDLIVVLHVISAAGQVSPSMPCLEHVVGHRVERVARWVV